MTSEDCERLRAIIDEQTLKIEALKRSFATFGRLSMYDVNYSATINEIAFDWLEHHICRHYLNGKCRNTAGSCTRIHTVISSKCLMRELDLAMIKKSIYSSRFIRQLLKNGAKPNWQSAGRIREMVCQLKFLMEEH